MEPTYLAELRADVLNYLVDTCDIYDQPNSAVSDGMGGFVQTTGDTVDGFEKIHSNVACRIQSTRMKISLGESTLGQKITAKDEGVLVLPYNMVISDACEIVLTSGEEEGNRYSITQQMSQTEAFTRVFAVLRIK